jgi:hypothetical protein
MIAQLEVGLGYAGSMSTTLGLRSLIGLGVLALITAACSPDPAGTDEAADSGSDTGTESSSGDDTTSTLTDSGTDDSSCDADALQTCIDAASATSTDCAGLCPATLLTCADADCSASCELERGSAESACQAAHCPGPPDETAMCEQGCWLEFSSCLAATDCDVHTCQWDAGFCLPECVGCTTQVELDFAFDGSCELALPELVHPVLLPYFSIEIAGSTFEVAEAGTPCDAPELGGSVEHPLQGDVLQLCPTVCDDFTDAGSLRVIVLGPC